MCELWELKQKIEENIFFDAFRDVFLINFLSGG